MKKTPSKRKISKKTSQKRRPKASKSFKLFKFLPALAITVFASFLSLQPYLLNRSTDNGVLAYATNVSVSGLLSATNVQRSNYNAGALSLNSKLNSAAQSKANDMVARDYWSHVTPDGQQPWAFITNAGYSYSSAGENLAYGFMTSGDTVTGWMNSPSHKANLISKTFTEVGFGIANSANYVGNGAQTIVVAMYAKPYASPPPPPPAPEPSPQPSQEVKSSQEAKKETTQKAEKAPEEEPKEEEPEQEEEEIVTVAMTEPSPPAQTTAAPASVNRLQLLTGGKWFWATTVLTVIVLAAGFIWLVHKSIRFKHYIQAGEHFLTRHIHLDLTVLSIIYLGFVLLSNSGTIR